MTVLMDCVYLCSVCTLCIAILPYESCDILNVNFNCRYGRQEDKKRNGKNNHLIYIKLVIINFRSSG